MSSYDTLAGWNALISIWIMGIAICRCGIMNGEAVRFRVRVQYILLVPAAFANGFAPALFQQWASLASVCFTFIVAIVMTLDGFQWKKGSKLAVPPAALTDTAKLRNADGSPLS